jgi:hypothetical protein
VSIPFCACAGETTGMGEAIGGIPFAGCQTARNLSGKSQRCQPLTGKTNADKAEGLAIIFSTMARVSPSRSLSFEFSGVIFVVSILGAVVTTCGHQTCWLSFSSETVTSRESSAVGPKSAFPDQESMEMRPRRLTEGPG